MNVGQIGNHKTIISKDNNAISVRYHNTDVVKVNKNDITLDNGGFYTATTKRRMNQASIQWELGIVVYQVNWEWYVKTKKDIYPYYNGMVINSKTGALKI